MPSSRKDTRSSDEAERTAPTDRADRTDGHVDADRGRWRFWIDRGGTFTDLVARSPDGGFATRKLLSENPEAYEDAAIQGIRDFLALEDGEPVPAERIDSVKMGTTVATNALLERAGEPTVLAITRGLKDVLEIGYQARQDIFALDIVKTEQLYREVIEIDERLHADGSIAVELDEAAATEALRASYERGLRSVAIVLMHSFREGCHENALADIARRIGFEQVSVSHEVTPLIRLVSRGDTSVLDAYLTPILRRYVNRVSAALGADTESGPRLLFMQSSGGLTAADRFQGRDAILSGPAGGIVGAALTSRQAGFEKMIGFDMGGTSTDVSHYAGRYERTFETEVAGVRLRAPMMDIHTVAAGGGSILHYDGSRFLVGPDSAGADPGPRAYRRDGPLTVTDINVALGRIDPDFFPSLFGPEQDRPLDVEAARAGFVDIAADVDDGRSWEAVAEGFLTIAIEHMAQAIKKISVERGYAVADYVLTCFGGAGGQHACLVAERLGMDKVLLHPFSGVLSAYGMGLAELSAQSQRMISTPLGDDTVGAARRAADELAEQGGAELAAQGVAAEDQERTARAMLRYRGSDTAIGVPLADEASMRERFEHEHRTQYGFVDRDKDIVLDYIDVEVKGGGEPITEPGATEAGDTLPERAATTACYTGGAWTDVPVHERDALPAGVRIEGPAIVVESNGTIVLEPGWSGELTAIGNLVLERTGRKEAGERNGDRESTDEEGVERRPDTPNPLERDPVTLEIFNRLFMSIAEQMGLVLKNTAQSVNIKERLDFSCAVFDASGALVANAPHVPVHLGSMDASVRAILESGAAIRPGDAFVHNNPYNGGTHLPDITVVTPVFDGAEELLFFTASRGHHADVGGITPGSMSPLADSIEQEGIVLDVVRLVSGGELHEADIRERLSSGEYPARSIDQNLADLKAQIAANAKGSAELLSLTESRGTDVVKAYMRHVMDNAEESVRRAISSLRPGDFEYRTDTDAVIAVTVTVDADAREATVSFEGTSAQQPTNFNAPAAITRAAVLYVFRCLVEDDIPLNAGCLRPLKIEIPARSMLNPEWPAAVVAGNVEVSQMVTNALFGALGVLGSSQGTMNNLTFGDAERQYYETICSGAPAGPGFHGASPVHTHMTNSHLTDPEVLEWRYPVVLESFGIAPDTGGRGEWNAGDGVYRRIRFLAEMECAILSGHRVTPPFGSRGGEPGRVGRNTVLRADGREEDLGGCGHTVMRAGDAIVIETPTGGGFGKREG